MSEIRNKKQSMNKEPRLRPVLVTTEYKGVFFGWIEKDQELPPDRRLELKAARLVVYWCAEVQGVFGLAATGPLKGSRIGPAVSSLLVVGVTAIADCSDESAELFGKDQWS